LDNDLNQDGRGTSNKIGYITCTWYFGSKDLPDGFAACDAANKAQGLVEFVVEAKAKTARPRMAWTIITLIITKIVLKQRPKDEY
jgi:hypothetical protein